MENVKAVDELTIESMTTIPTAPVMGTETAASGTTTDPLIVGGRKSPPCLTYYSTITVKAIGRRGLLRG